jgi:hypothetical protein
MSENIMAASWRMYKMGGIATNVPNCLVNSIRGKLIFTSLWEIIWLGKIINPIKTLDLLYLDLNLIYESHFFNYDPAMVYFAYSSPRQPPLPN